MVTSGGPVSRPAAGIASATSAAVATRPCEHGPARDPAAAAHEPVPGRARGTAERGMTTRSMRRPSSVSTAGSTTTAAPVASVEQSSTPMPSDIRIVVGAIAAASTSATISAVPATSTARPAERRPRSRPARRRAGRARATPPRGSGRASSARSRCRARGRPSRPSATAIGSVSITVPSSAITPEAGQRGDRAEGRQQQRRDAVRAARSAGARTAWPTAISSARGSRRGPRP